jgi:hypothetical protein
MQVVDHSTTEAIDDGWQQPRSYLEGGVAVGGESVTCQEMKSAVQAGEQVGLQHEKPPEAVPPTNSAAAFDPTVEKEDAVGAATQPTDKRTDVASENAPEHPHTLFLRYRTHQATCSLPLSLKWRWCRSLAFASTPNALQTPARWGASDFC